MKRSITRWTTTLATAAVLGLPAVGSAQSPSTTPPRTTPQAPGQQPAPEPPSKTPPVPSQPASEPPAQPTPQPGDAPVTTQPPSDPGTAVPKGSSSTSTQADQTSPEEHLQQAKDALEAIPAGSVGGSAKTQLAELKRHMAALNRASATAAADPTTAANANWSTEVAAMDKLLADLLAAGPPHPQPTRSRPQARLPPERPGAVRPALPGPTGTKESSTSSRGEPGRGNPDETHRSAEASDRVCGSQERLGHRGAQGRKRRECDERFLGGRDAVGFDCIIDEWRKREHRTELRRHTGVREQPVWRDERSIQWVTVDRCSRGRRPVRGSRDRCERERCNGGFRRPGAAGGTS